MKTDENRTTGNPEVSIIVPVYKVEKYLEICLFSIMNQTFTDFECIMVNDGSPDNCGQICEKFVNLDSRFKLINKGNGGLSSARNTGFKFSTGKYISFIDSDDWIDQNYLSILHGLIVSNGADIAMCGYVKEFKTFTRKKPLKNLPHIIKGEEAILELLLYNNLPGYIWNKLFRREIIVSFFPEGKAYEDYYAMNEWGANIKKIAITPEILYHYRIRKGSITKSGDATLQLDFMNAVIQRAKKLKDLLPDYFSEETESIFLYRNLLERAKIIARNEKNPVKRKDSINLILLSLKKIPRPTLEKLGKKLSKRTELLENNPEKFIKKMIIAGKMDIHDKFCATQVYE